MTTLIKHCNHDDSFNIKFEKIFNFLKTQSKQYGLKEVIFDPESDPEIENIFKIKVPENISFEEMNRIWDEITENTEKYSLKNKTLTKYFKDVFIILDR
jgi:hypothetical protein